MKLILTALFIFLGVSISYAIDFKYKEIEDFKVLSSFQSVRDFEDNFGKYTQNCLDNTYGGTGGIPCFVSSKIWDRELNLYYKKLSSRLEDAEKSKLKESQVSWLKTRDLSIELINKVLDKKYNKQGTMFLLMRVGDFDSAISAIIKERALTLKNLEESIK